MAASFATVGCGIGSLATGSSDVLVAGPMTGQLKGGPNPITGATISVWVTGNITGTTLTSQGYGVGTRMQTVTSGASGNFSFTGGYACPAGQFLYLTSSGGNTGAGTNNLAVLVAALGRCEDLYSNGRYTGPFIYMNELTTVAAAYALSGFATTSGNGSGASVTIGAPATNNAAVGSATAAAGLRHAFQNAANLVDINQPSVSANFRVPSNSSGIVPVQLINSIANTLVSCVNTAGSNSGACNVVFGATGTSTSSNTFQAMLNLAKSPTLAGSGYTSADFLNAASAATNFYQPVLTSAPVDYSIAIQYNRGIGFSSGVTQGLQYPKSAALDANDNFYVGNTDAATPTKYNLVSFTSNGTLATFTPDAAGTSQVLGLSTDAAGHLYRADSGNAAVVRYTVDNTSGTITTPATATISTFGNQPVYTAADRRNNLWFVSSNSTVLGEVAAGGSTTTAAYNIQSAGAQVAVDPNQNIWATDSNNVTIAGNRVSILQNIGTAASPVYNGDQATSSNVAGQSADGIAFVTNGPNYTAYVTNQTSTGGITPVVPTISGAPVLSVAVGSQVTTNYSAPNTVKSDGGGVLWTSDNSGNGLERYIQGNTASTVITPCVPSSMYVNAVCFTNAAANDLVIDSTGTIWTVHAGSGSVTQIIGSASPTWPLLSLGLLGKP